MQRVLFQLFILGCMALISAPAEAQKGTGYVVERIEVRGNEKTKPEVILRSLKLQTGDRLTPGRLTASREALYRTGLFRTVHVASKPGTESGKAVVIVYVNEKRFGDLGVSLEYTELDGFSIAADAYHVNLLGEGKVVGSEFTHGERIKYWGLSYTDPWLSGTLLSLHLQVSSGSWDRDLYRSKTPEKRGRYDLDRTGASLGLGQTIGAKYRVILRYSYEEVEVGDFKAPAILPNDTVFPQEVGAATGRKPVTLLGVDLRRQSTGKPWGSAAGTDLHLQVDYSASYLGSTGDFLRLRTEAYQHFETIQGQILSIGGRAGAILGSPLFYDRFYLDGPNQLRGFEQREIGSEGGTEFVSAELVYSLPVQPVGRIYMFVEGAAVRRTVNGAGRSNTGSTFGVGLLLFNRVDFSFGIGTGTLILKSHRFGGINVGL